MAGIYNGHLLEFPTIRVDCFLPTSPTILLPPPTTSSSTSGPSSIPQLAPAPNAQLFLLTHVHSDHLLGLTDKFTGKILCSPDTKRMLLNLEPELERGRMEVGLRESRTLKYPGLRRRVEKVAKDEKVVDRIEAVPYGHPKQFEIGYKDGKPQIVTITLLDANHCPGSTMFLITSPDKAVLHTGDIRADKQFIQNLQREPALQQFLIPASTYAGTNHIPNAGRRVLDRIYLDTSAVLGTGDMPDREPVLRDLVEQMGLYPPDTIFFLDTWCFGWEYVIEEVSRYFGEPVHVDRYKRCIYTAIETDPYLLSCTTADPGSTRFHACERVAKCSACRRFEKGNSKPVYNLDKRIVSVNMVEVKEASWALQHQSFLEALRKAAIGEGPWPYSINVPLARHSPLPELQNLVRLFRPKGISPNTVVPSLKGMDYYLLPDFMRDHVAQGAYQGMVRDRNAYFETKYGKGFVDGLSQVKIMGMGTGLGGMDAMGAMPGMADFDVSHMVEIVGNSNIVRNWSRQATAKDQMMRAGGLLPFSPDEMMRMIQGGGGATKVESVDSDTDDETPRKRRRGEYIKEESGSLAPEPSPSLSLSPSVTRRALPASAVTVGRYEIPSSLAENADTTKKDGSSHSSQVDIKTEPESMPLPSLGPGPPQVERIRDKASKRDKKALRFSLGSDEKERIRMLMLMQMQRDRALFAGVGGEGEGEGEDGEEDVAE